MSTTLTETALTETSTTLAAGRREDAGTPQEAAVYARKPDGDVILPTLCARDLILPSSLNPRKRFDAEELESLAESIRQHGVLQPILLRPGGTGNCYDIVLGERRWRAAGVAGVTNLPVIIRDDIDDKLHVKLAMEENIRRDDLTTMEKARGFRAMMDAGWSQEEIGKGLGRGNASISNTVRLLELPEGVQAMIEDGRLSAAHGVALLRYKDFPALTSCLAEAAVKKGWASKALEAGLGWEQASAARGAKLIVDFSDYQNKPAFDVNAVCVRNCPFGAYKRSPDNNAGYCLNPEHFKSLQTDAIRVRDERTAGEVERSRQAALAKVKQAKEAAATATTKAGREAAEKDVERASKAAAANARGLPTLQSLGWGNYADLNSPPPGCSADCPCRAKALDHGGRVVDVCMDPKRLGGLKARVTRDEQKDRRVRFEGFETQVRERLPADRVDTRALALLLWPRISSAKKPVRSAVAERLPSGGGYEAVAALLGQAQTRDEQAWAVLSNYPAPFLVNLTAEISLCQEMAEQLEYKGDAVPKTKWLLSAQAAASPGTPPGLPAREDPAAEEGEYFPMEWACDRCQGPLPVGCFESVMEYEEAVEAESVDPSMPRFVRMTSGEMLTCKGMSYCEDCAPSVRVCQDCGCTDEAACEGGCSWGSNDLLGSWADDDVCSACAPTHLEPDAPILTLEKAPVGFRVVAETTVAGDAAETTVAGDAPGGALFTTAETEQAQAPRYAGPGPVFRFQGEPDSFDGALFTMLTGGVGAMGRWAALRQDGADDRQLSLAIRHEISELYFKKGATSLGGNALIARVRTLMKIPTQLTIPEQDAAEQDAAEQDAAEAEDLRNDGEPMDDGDALNDGEPIDVGGYLDVGGYQPRDLTGYCGSCGVVPVNAGGKLCDRCDPAAVDREAIEQEERAICRL